MYVCIRAMFFDAGTMSVWPTQLIKSLNDRIMFFVFSYVFI